MKEQRARQRRNYGPARIFPLKDSDGCVVIFDRSRTADRRLNDLVLEELCAEEVQMQNAGS